MNKHLTVISVALLILGSASCVSPDKQNTVIRNDDGSRVVKTLSDDGTTRTETRYRSDNSVAYEKTYREMTRGARPKYAVVRDSSGRVTMSENYLYNDAGQLQQLETLNAQGEVVVIMRYVYSAGGKYAEHQHTDGAGRPLSQEQVEAIWAALEPK